MNLIEIAENLKDVPDQYLLQEVQRPTGNYPAYLVVSELGRRKRMRESVAKEAPKTTVVEDLTAPQRQQAMAQMAQMLQPQDQNMIPQAGGLNVLPQAQQDLAAMDMVSAQPQMAPQMPEVPAMAGGGMVSFRQGGDVIRAFNGLPEDMFFGTPSDSGMGLSQVIDQDPNRFISGIGGILAPSSIYFDYMTPEEQAVYERSGVIPDSAKQKYAQAQVSKNKPTAVTPVSRPVATAPTTPAPVPEGTPAPEVTPAGPTLGDQISQILSSRPPVPPAVGYTPARLPAFASPEEISAARARKIAEFEQAVPDRATPFFQEDISRRERDIEGRRQSNINEALIQAGLGIMGSKSPRFLGAVSEGGTAGLNALRQGRKDIMQSEEALRSARAKMIESQTLRDQGKFAAGKEARLEAKEDFDRGLSLYNTVESQKYRQASLQSQNYQNQLNAFINQQRLNLEGLKIQRDAELDPVRKRLIEAQIKQAEASAEAALRGKAADPAVVAGLEVKARTALGISLDEYKNDPKKRERVDNAVRESLERQGYSYPGISVPSQSVDYQSAMGT